MTQKNLHVLITADAKDVEAKAGRVQAAFHKMEQAVSVLNTVLGAVGVGLGVHEMIHSLERGLDQIVEMKHASDALGISLDKIAGIKFAVTSAGGNWEATEVGLGKMLKNLGAAQLGSKEAAHGFHLLGIEAESLEGLKTEDSLSKIIDRLHGIEDPAQRAYVASQLFGKGWQAMIPLIEGGSASLEKAIKAAGEVTEEMARDAMRTKKDLKELGEAWDDFWRKRAAGFAAGRDKPIFKPGTTQLLTNDEWKAMRETAEPLTVEPKKSPKQIAEEDARTKLIDSIGDLEAKLRDEGAALLGGGRAVDEFARKHADATPEMLATARALEAENESLKEFTKTLEFQERELGKGLEEFDRGAEDMLKHSQSAAERFNEELLKTQMYLAAGTFSAEEFDKVVGHLADEFIRANAAKDSANNPLLQLGGAAEFGARVKMQSEAAGPQDALEQVKETLKRSEQHARETKQYMRSVVDAAKKVGLLTGP